MLWQAGARHYRASTRRRASPRPGEAGRRELPDEQHQRKGGGHVHPENGDRKTETGGRPAERRLQRHQPEQSGQLARRPGLLVELWNRRDELTMLRPLKAPNVLTPTNPEAVVGRFANRPVDGFRQTAVRPFGSLTAKRRSLKPDVAGWLTLPLDGVCLLIFSELGQAQRQVVQARGDVGQERVGTPLRPAARES
jgi:hypothetical protein